MKKEHFEILLEDINGKFDLVLEGYQVLRDEIIRTREELCEKIDENTARIKINTDMIVTLDGKIDAVDEKLSARIDAVEEKLSNRIDKLSGRVDSVEENLGNRIDAVAADLKAHRADTEIHHGIYRVRELQQE